MKDYAERLEKRGWGIVLQFLAERLTLLFFVALIMLQFAAIYEMIRTFVR